MTQTNFTLAGTSLSLSDASQVFERLGQTTADSEVLNRANDVLEKINNAFDHPSPPQDIGVKTEAGGQLDAQHFADKLLDRVPVTTWQWVQTQRMDGNSSASSAAWKTLEQLREIAPQVNGKHYLELESLFAPSYHGTSRSSEGLAPTAFREAHEHRPAAQKQGVLSDIELVQLAHGITGIPLSWVSRQICSYRDQDHLPGRLSGTDYSFTGLLDRGRAQELLNALPQQWRNAAAAQSFDWPWIGEHVDDNFIESLIAMTHVDRAWAIGRALPGLGQHGGVERVQNLMSALDPSQQSKAWDSFVEACTIPLNLVDCIPRSVIALVYDRLAAWQPSDLAQLFSSPGFLDAAQRGELTDEGEFHTVASVLSTLAPLLAQSMNDDQLGRVIAAVQASTEPLKKPDAAWVPRECEPQTGADKLAELLSKQSGANGRSLGLQIAPLMSKMSPGYAREWVTQHAGAAGELFSVLPYSGACSAWGPQAFAKFLATTAPFRTAVQSGAMFARDSDEILPNVHPRSDDAIWLDLQHAFALMARDVQPQQLVAAFAPLYEETGRRTIGVQNWLHSIANEIAAPASLSYANRMASYLASADRSRSREYADSTSAGVDISFVADWLNTQRLQATELKPIAQTVVAALPGVLDAASLSQALNNPALKEAVQKETAVRIQRESQTASQVE